ncbi:MAG: hypothetical protein A2521_10805 [Deltaproteobacteria bacterium RIFOXYD12_FULL_57_12]|nr:MAG: hypothetical protein A2521_10805 [Deltaproteobacteria bacterium RIFOXYD12_FULL_57_12]
MPESYTIRPARQEDLPAMLEVLKTVNMHHIPSPEMPELDWQCCFVAEVGDRVVGMSGYKILSATEGKTTLLAVLPEYRRSGIGRALQVKRMQILLDRDIRFLTTNADRPETIAWYKKYFGYQEIGSLPKEHEFGRVDVDRWTTLKTDLVSWDKARDHE